jgi:hypothetical protein
MRPFGWVEMGWVQACGGGKINKNHFVNNSSVDILEYLFYYFQV